jgi:hypothetical protein
MDITDRNRLLKLIGMLGSEHDGERANASAFIAKMAAERKMTITELMEEAHGKPVEKVVYKEKVVYRDAPAASPQYPHADAADAADAGFTDIGSPLIAMMRQVAAKPALAQRVLTDWEVNFVTDVSARYDYDTHLSDKQLVIVERILKKASRVFTW